MVGNGITIFGTFSKPLTYSVGPNYIKKIIVEIFRTSRNELFSIAFCHSKCFPKSLASALGITYLKVMFAWYQSTSKTFLFHICENNEVIGYCGGIISDGTLSTGSSSGMAQYSFFAAIRAFIVHPWVLLHPEILAKWPILYRNLLMKFGLKSKNHFSREEIINMSKLPKVGLVVIGVHPDFQGRGYGSVILKEFERISIDEYKISNLELSVSIDNVRAIQAYQTNGWKVKQQNNRSFIMSKTL